MLFLLNAQGVPSVSRWVRLDPSAPDRPMVTAQKLATTGKRAAALKKCAKKKRGKARKKCRKKAKKLPI